MKVYVAEIGCYSDRYLKAVYSTLEQAIADNKGNFKQCECQGGLRPVWDNDLDWDSAVTIWEEEVR